MRCCLTVIVLLSLFTFVAGSSAAEPAATSELPAAVKALGLNGAAVVKVDRARAIRGEGFFPDFLVDNGPSFSPNFLVAGDHGSFPNFLTAKADAGYFPNFLSAGVNGGYLPNFLQSSGSGMFPSFLQSK